MKCRKALFERGFWKSCGTLHVWRSYRNYGFPGRDWLTGIELYTGRKSVSDYYWKCRVIGTFFAGCIDVYLEKRRGDSEVKQELGTCLAEAVSWKYEGWRSRFLLVECCGWVVIIGSVCEEICWRLAHWERFGRVWEARADRWRPGKINGSRMGNLQWLVSYWLLQLNPEEQGEHLTGQLSGVVAWLLATSVCSAYPVDELVIVFCCPL